MPPAAPRPNPHPGPAPEPITEDPELLACWALRRAHRGGVTTSGDQYVDHGCLKLNHLTPTFEELTNAGLLALTEADPCGLQRVSLTRTGRNYYTQLIAHRMTRSAPEPPTPAGRRSSCPDPLVTPGGQPDPDNTMIGIPIPRCACSTPPPGGD